MVQTVLMVQQLTQDMGQKKYHQQAVRQYSLLASILNGYHNIHNSCLLLMRLLLGQNKVALLDRRPLIREEC